MKCFWLVAAATHRKLRSGTTITLKKDQLTQNGQRCHNQLR
jgi:hypothetical protein